MKNTKTVMLSSLLALTLSCIDENDLDPVEDATTPEEVIELPEDPTTAEVQQYMSSLEIPLEFNYSTSKTVEVSLSAPIEMSDAIFRLYAKTGANDPLEIGTAMFDDQGRFSRGYAMSMIVDTLIVETLNIEDVATLRLPVTGESVTFDYASLYQQNDTQRMAAQKAVRAARFTDIDNDGVPDAFDQYPNDPLRAHNNYSPSASTYGVVTFEDLYPAMGDFDFNDLAVKYRYNVITTNSVFANVLEVEFVIDNVGGAYENTFGFVLRIPPSLITSITGQQFDPDNFMDIRFDDKGIERDTFDQWSVIHVLDNTLGTQGQTFNIVVEFTNPVDPSSLGSVPYDPFILANGLRNREVHLVSGSPTGWLDTTTLYTNSVTGKFFTTDNNLPFALDVFDGFILPQERSAIVTEYPQFTPWAQSDGSLYSDWYNHKN